MHDFSASNAIQILTPLATLVVLLALMAGHSMNSYTAAAAYIVASLPAFWLMLYRVRRKGLRATRPRIAAMKQILQYGIRSYGIDVLGTLALQVDQVLVVSLLSAGAMGSYVVVLSISRMLNVFQTSVVMVLFPKAAGLNKSGQSDCDDRRIGANQRTGHGRLRGGGMHRRAHSASRDLWSGVRGRSRRPEDSGPGSGFVGNYFCSGAGIHGIGSTRRGDGPAGHRAFTQRSDDVVADSALRNIWSCDFAAHLDERAADFCLRRLQNLPQDFSSSSFAGVA